MTTPIRLTLSRKKGFDLQALSIATNGLDAVVVTRASKKWGNPWKIERQPYAFVCDEPVYQVTLFGNMVRRGTRRHCAEYAVREHRKHAWRFRKAIRTELRGKNLACSCKANEPCHADNYLDLANR